MTENQPMTVYVLVFWPGNPEDRPPEILAVAANLDRATQAAADHARNELHIRPPTDWTIDDDNAYVGQLEPEILGGDLYYGAEERCYVIHEKTILQ